MGHSSYLMFALQLVNFLLITYNFLIEGNKIFEAFITDLWVFVTIVTIFYIPISILIGKWHTDTQIKEEMQMKMFQDPITAKMIRDIQDKFNYPKTVIVATGKNMPQRIIDVASIIKGWQLGASIQSTDDDVLKASNRQNITSSAYKKVFKGKIETISSRIDPSTRSILSRIIVDNSNFEIIPGQLMTVKIIYDEKNQIGVPESAVTIQGNTAFVYTVNEDTAEKKNIEIGKRNFGKVSIISGLNEGDLVISEGVSKVRDKGKIKIITSTK